MTDHHTDYSFIAFGLKIQSHFDLPEMTSSTPGIDGPENTIFIKQGKVPHELSDGRRITPYMAISESSCLYTFEGVARLLIQNGSEIVVELEEGGLESDMRAYLIGSGLGTLSHQRKMLPLHVSTLLSPSGAIAFTGHSGAGKSTVASMLHRKTGWPLISDDLAVLDLKEETPKLHAGVIRIKLWNDALAKFGPDSGSVTRDIARLEKFHVHAPELFSDGVHALSHLMLLDRGAALELEAMKPSKSFEAIMSSIYRPELVNYFNDPVAVFQKCARVAEQIDTSKFTRVWSNDGLASSIDFLAERFS